MYINKILGYAVALDSDIAAEEFSVVENGKLWRGWIGTVYGSPVSTERGYKFLSKQAAIDNAHDFVKSCAKLSQQTQEGGKNG